MTQKLSENCTKRCDLHLRKPHCFRVSRARCYIGLTILPHHKRNVTTAQHRPPVVTHSHTLARAAGRDWIVFLFGLKNSQHDSCDTTSFISKLVKNVSCNSEYIIMTFDRGFAAYLPLPASTRYHRWNTNNDIFLRNDKLPLSRQIVPVYLRVHRNS